VSHNYIFLTTSCAILLAVSVWTSVYLALSLLGRYLRRFRTAPPRRREDRRAPSHSEFWWGTTTGPTQSGSGGAQAKRNFASSSEGVGDQDSSVAATRESSGEFCVSSDSSTPTRVSDTPKV